MKLAEAIRAARPPHQDAGKLVHGPLFLVLLVLVDLCVVFVIQK
jgi:hypothetical protein